MSETDDTPIEEERTLEDPVEDVRTFRHRGSKSGSFYPLFKVKTVKDSSDDEPTNFTSHHIDVARGPHQEGELPIEDLEIGIENAELLESRVSRLERNVDELSERTQDLSTNQNIESAVKQIISEGEVVSENILDSHPDISSYLEEKYDLQPDTIEEFHQFKNKALRYHQANLTARRRLRRAESIGVIMVGSTMILASIGLLTQMPSFVPSLLDKVVVGVLSLVGLLLLSSGALGLRKAGE